MRVSRAGVGVGRMLSDRNRFRIYTKKLEVEASFNRG
jgi:hypothetical protein